MDYKELASRCLKRSKMEYEDATMIMLECSAKAITDLLARAEVAEVRAEKAERERDAAVFDLKRAEEVAEETYILINSKIQPVFDYSVYTAIHDSVSDIVDWKKDEVWRGMKEE